MYIYIVIVLIICLDSVVLVLTPSSAVKQKTL